MYYLHYSCNQNQKKNPIFIEHFLNSITIQMFYYVYSIRIGYCISYSAIWLEFNYTTFNTSLERGNKILLTLSGKDSNDRRTGSRLPNLEDLNRRRMSCRVEATRKYSCFRRSSFPEKNCQHQESIYYIGYTK